MREKKNRKKIERTGKTRKKKQRKQTKQTKKKEKKIRGYDTCRLDGLCDSQAQNHYVTEQSASPALLSSYLISVVPTKYFV